MDLGIALSVLTRHLSTQHLSTRNLSASLPTQQYRDEGNVQELKRVVQVCSGRPDLVDAVNYPAAGSVVCKCIQCIELQDRPLDCPKRLFWKM